MRTSVITPYTAYLRVYEPVQAFPEPARARWRRYVSSGATLDRIAGSQAEHQQALAGLLATPPLLVPAHESTDAYGLIVDGSVLLCPVQTRLRCWRAIAEIRKQGSSQWPRDHCGQFNDSYARQGRRRFVRHVSYVLCSRMP